MFRNKINKKINNVIKIKFLIKKITKLKTNKSRRANIISLSRKSKQSKSALHILLKNFVIIVRSLVPIFSPLRFFFCKEKDHLLFFFLHDDGFRLAYIHCVQDENVRSLHF